MPVFIVQHWGPKQSVDEVQDLKKGPAGNISIVKAADVHKANTIAWNYASHLHCKETGEPFHLLPCYMVFNALPSGMILIMRPHSFLVVTAEMFADMEPASNSLKGFEGLTDDHTLVRTSYWKVDTTKPKGEVIPIPIENNLFGACVLKSQLAATMEGSGSVVLDMDGSGTMTIHEEVPGDWIIWNPSNASKILADLRIPDQGV